MGGAITNTRGLLKTTLASPTKLQQQQKNLTFQVILAQI